MRREASVASPVMAILAIIATSLVVTAILATTAAFYWELGQRAANSLMGGPPVVTHRHVVEPGRRPAVSPPPKKIRERLTESDPRSGSVITPR